MNTLLIGFDIGGTKSAVVVGTDTGEIIDRQEWASDAWRGPQAMIEDCISAARIMYQNYPAIARAGVSIGGPLDARPGVIHEPPNLPGWKAVPLRDILSAALLMPVIVQHDAAACAYAESLWGAGRDARNLVYFTCGTGFGAGMVFSGKIHTGSGGLSCEVGHVRLRRDGPTRFGKQGSAEAFCSGAALPHLAAWQFPRRWGASPPTGGEIGMLAEQGDPDAIEVVRINARAVGEVAAMLADALGLDMVILGSLARYLGQSWVDEVRRSFRSEVLPSVAKVCRVEPAFLGDRLQDCSALAAALAPQE